MSTHYFYPHTFVQIWEAVDEKQGHLSRNGLYKALALTALAQQGKSINEKILESYTDQGTLHLIFTIFLHKHLFVKYLGLFYLCMYQMLQKYYQKGKCVRIFKCLSLTILVCNFQNYPSLLLEI